MGNKIEIGDYTFTDNIVSGNCILHHAMVGETLSSDTIDFVIRTDDESIESAFTDGEEIVFSYNDSVVSKFYFDSIKRTAENLYKIVGLSVIGMLAKSQHYGGMYTNALASVVIADIISGYTYTLDATLANSTITGYLPVASRRDNLQQVLFAIGATIKNVNNGDLQIFPMSSVQTGIFGADRCFIGGSVDTAEKVDAVQLTEHNYFISQEVDTLFDDSISSQQTIVFSEPHHSLSITGGTIIASGANYAKVSVSGQAGYVTLTGKKYTHVTRVITHGTIPANGGNVKQVTSAYLANPSVAETLCERVYNCLNCLVTINQDVVFGSEIAGDAVSVINPYTNTNVNATIKQMSINMSGKNTANTEFLVGFTPQGGISGYTHSVLLTGSGAWTVPSGVSKIRAIIVGGGSGGNGSYKGNNGGSTQVSETKTRGGSSWRDYYNEVVGNPYGAGGQGGKGGNAGQGGKIFEISIDVTAGSSIQYACGSAGTGGAIEGGAGTSGVATTFGQYSSNFGRNYPYGYYEPKNNLTLGANGATGLDGGDGGQGSQTIGYDAQNPSIYTGQNGGTVNLSHGGYGAIGYKYSYDDEWDYYHTYTVGGGGGGGASNGAPCDNYQANYPPRGSGSEYRTTYLAIINGGNGSNGSNGTNAISTNYGAGGGGGNGGGGGGGASVFLYSYRFWTDFYDLFTAGTGGTGGTGGRGGNGAAGCVVVYY